MTEQTDSNGAEEIWAVPGGAPEVTVEARRLAESLTTPGGGSDRDGRTDHPNDERPTVVAIGFEGIETDADLTEGPPDEALTLSPSDGEFIAGASGVSARADGLSSLTDTRGDPLVVLFSNTPDHDDVAAATAGRFRGGCVTDCLPRVRDASILAGRSVYGGRAYAEFSFEGGPPALTLHVDVLPAPSEVDGDVPTTTHVVDITTPAQSGLRQVTVIDVPEQDLSRAQRIVSGGFGLGDPSGFDVISDLADALGAAVGASRPPADEGWVPYDRQIGVTGTEIDAELYIPCAISGDPYHMRSVNAEHIIPINDDPDARIFNAANLGILGDIYEYGPVLAEAVKKAKAEQLTTDGSGEKHPTDIDASGGAD